MKINHHISFRVDDDRKTQLVEYGVDVSKAWKMFSWSSMEDFTFDILEDDCRWPNIEPLVKEWKGIDVISTSFSTPELRNAQYMSVDSTWYCLKDDEYLNSFYDKSHFCPTCGIGKKQMNPFRMRMEPKWGTRHVVQYYGHEDELFVRSEIWHDVFKPFGIGCLPVFKKNTDQELKTVVQLKIDKIADSVLQTEKLDYVLCPDCNQKTYDAVRRGCIPYFQEEPKKHIFKTQEYFYPSANPTKLIVISQEVYQVIKKYKLKSLRYTPLSADVLDDCHGRK